MRKSDLLDIKIDPVESAVETIVMLNIAAYSNREDLQVDLPQLDKTLKDHVVSIQNGVI